MARPLSPIRRALAAFGLMLLLAVPAEAQGLFAPIIKVNGRVITQYELNQRIAILKFINNPGDPAVEAEKSLIEDRLIQQELDGAGLAMDDDRYAEALANFAKRGNLTPDQLLAQLAQNGIAPESLRDFLMVRALWPEYVQTRFGPRLTITEAEIDRALALAGQQGSARVLLSEIILPADAARAEQALALAEEIKEKGTRADVFADAARRFSISQSRLMGGDIDWLPINRLPGTIVPVLLTMQTGQVTDPIPVGENLIAIFRLRALEEVAAPPPTTLSVEYAQFLLPGGRSPETLARAEALRDRLDTCDDLYPILRENPGAAARFTRETLPVSKLPRGIALELAKLDPNEVSFDRTVKTGDTEALALVMLCGRVTELEEGARLQVRQQLANQRIQAYAEGYVQELRADAIIERP